MQPVSYLQPRQTAYATTERERRGDRLASTRPRGRELRPRENTSEKVRSLEARLDRLENEVIERLDAAVATIAGRQRTHEDAEAVRPRFEALAEEWALATKTPSSFLRDKFMHPAYQQIIGLGPSVLPLLLSRMASAPDHWGWALQAITGEDPVPEEDAGDIEAIARAWLAWANRHGVELAEAKLQGVSK
jgi:hypothetical protein